jgi:type I restriction enzyme S subunit
MLEKIKTKDFYETEIPSGWAIRKLGDCCLKKGEYGINAPAVEYSNQLPTYLRITDIDNEGNYSSIKEVSVDDNNSHKFILRKGDIVFARTGATVGKTYLYDDRDGELVFAGFLIRFRTNEIFLLAEYLKFYSSTKAYWQWVKTISMRSGQPGINAEEYGSLKIPLPPLPEQKAIAQLLSTWNDAITKTQALIAQKEERKKWLMQNLLTGKKRINNSVKSEKKHKTSLGELPVDWKITFLKNIMTPVKKSFIPDQAKLYQQIGIRSHTKGLFYKEKVTGASLGDKSVFWIEPNCFIVNIVFAWEHAIAKTTEKEIGMIASHRFPMFKPKERLLDLDFLLYYFKSLRGKHLLGLASPGGAGRNKTLGQSEFLKLQIPIPSLSEQLAIANLLQSADTELQLLKNKMEKLKEQKKGLMQVLLTGKKRLKIKQP